MSAGAGDANLNFCTFTGKVITPPESRLSKNAVTVVCSFRMHVNSRVQGQGGSFKSEPLYLNCDATGGPGKYIQQYVFVGDTIHVQGRLRSYPPSSDFPGYDLKVQQVQFIASPMRTKDGANIYEAPVDAEGGIIDLAARSMGAIDPEYDLALTADEIEWLLDHHAARFDRNREQKHQRKETK